MNFPNSRYKNFKMEVSQNRSFNFKAVQRNCPPERFQRSQKTIFCIINTNEKDFIERFPHCKFVMQ